MGGLRKSMPKTYVAFLAGSLAAVGIFPFAGFFSKDSILASALASGGYGQLLFAAGLVGTLLTGLNTFRLSSSSSTASRRSSSRSTTTGPATPKGRGR